jgi:hypothetical protein
MLANKTFSGRAVVFFVVFAVFLTISSGNLVRKFGVALTPSVEGTVNAPVLSADGTSPLPQPQPWFMTAA